MHQQFYNHNLQMHTWYFLLKVPGTLCKCLNMFLIEFSESLFKNVCIYYVSLIKNTFKLLKLFRRCTVVVKDYCQISVCDNKVYNL